VYQVLRWPKQVKFLPTLGFSARSDFLKATPDAKVPSVLFYDEKGCARGFGAETEDDDMTFQAETGKWRITEWYESIEFSCAG